MMIGSQSTLNIARSLMNKILFLIGYNRFTAELNRPFGLSMETALNFSRKTETYFFGEMATMTLSLTLGKCAALPIPLIHRSCEPFAEEISRWHPVFWILHDRRGFFAKYDVYRNDLTRYILDMKDSSQDASVVAEFLDLCFLSFFCPQWDLSKGKVLERLDELKGNAPAEKLDTDFKIYRPKPPSWFVKQLQRIEAGIQRWRSGAVGGSQSEFSTFEAQGISVDIHQRLRGFMDHTELDAMSKEVARYTKI